MKIVTFGTSLTARGGWQEPLRASLAGCLGHAVEIATIAKSGSTSDWALAHVASVVAERPDAVLVEFYANDAALNRFTRVSASRANMEEVFRTLRSGLPNARLFVMAMNPMHGLRGAIRPFIDSYIEAHIEVGADFGANFLDFRPLWTARGEAWLTDAVPDGTHPKAEAASAVMVPSLVEALSDGKCGNNPPADRRQAMP